MSRILVADDNSNIQKMVALALKDLGIEVVAVGNGEAAIRKIADAAPDLVLADIFMPVRSGYEVCEFVKNDERYAHIPVILLVGTFDPLDEKEAQRVGADGVLKKPFVPPDSLIALVRSTLERLARHPEGLQVAPHKSETRLEVPAAGAPAATPSPAPAANAPPHQVAAPPAGVVREAAESEAETEEFIAKPSPVVFQEEQKVSAFGELLAEPTTAFGSEPGSTPETEEPGWGAGKRPGASAESPFGEAEATVHLGDRSEVAPRPLGFQPTTEPAPTPEPWHPAELPEIPGGVGAGTGSGTGFNAAPWIESASNFPAESFPGHPASEGEPVPAETPRPAATAAGVISFPGGEEPAGESVHGPGGVSSPELEPRQAGSAVVAQKFADRTPIDWPAIASQTPSSELLPLSPSPSPSRAAPPVPPEAPGQIVDPAMLDTVVEKVMSQLQPQILELISQKVVRPVVASLLEREREKKRE